MTIVQYQKCFGFILSMLKKINISLQKRLNEYSETLQTHSTVFKKS